MTFEWLNLQPSINLIADISSSGYLLIMMYVVILAVIIRQDWSRLEGLHPRNWLLMLGLIFASIISPLLLVLTLGSGDTTSQVMIIPLLSLLPLFSAALWLGITPAIGVGLSLGFSLSIFYAGQVSSPFEFALLGAVLAAVLNQTYQGKFSEWLRQPLVGAVLMTLAAALILLPLPTVLFSEGVSPLSGLERLSSLYPVGAAMIIEAIVAGGLLQLLLLFRPEYHPIVDKTTIVPPWGKHLGKRIIYAFIPLTALVILVLVTVVSLSSYQVGTRLVIGQMARDASNVSSGIPFFVEVGRSLIRDLSGDFEVGDVGEIEAALESDLRQVPFFQQLIYIDGQGRPIAAYPPQDLDSLLPAAERSRIEIALDEGSASELSYFSGETGAALSMDFLVPVVDNDSGEVVGVLVGQTVLDTNAIIAPAVDVLKGGFVGDGEGFIIDGQGRILLYPAHPEQQDTLFSIADSKQISGIDSGQAFRQRNEDGSRQIVYLLPVSGHSDWQVVVLVPNEVAFALALQIALPTLLIALVLAGIALPLLIAQMQQISVPIEELLEAVERVSRGELDRPLHTDGDDEIGMLGEAFEQMRHRLKARLTEQDQLLRVSRSVSSSLELFRSLPPILSSGLEVTHAAGVRIALRKPGSDDLQTYGAGDTAASMAVLDSEIIELVEHQGIVVISQLARVRDSLNIDALPERLKGIVAFPLRGDTNFYGVFWLSYDHVHTFEEAEMTFLATLAGQAAIAITNARLFGGAEAARRQVEAVLESTADAMVVSDKQGKIVLMNPAAERFFGIRSEQAKGLSAREVISSPELANLLTDLQEPVMGLELPDLKGKTLLANTSTIVSHNGAISGRVAVLRDITALKELDSIKTVFLRMVSHDMRSPLTYMSGYLSMLPLSGDLNESQVMATEKIKLGIEHIAELTERLLYLSRIQFGESAQLEMVHLDVKDALYDVQSKQETFIRDKDATFTIEVEEGLPLLEVDGVLFRQALINLVSNAIKYTPSGGQVTVRAFRSMLDRLTISVSDNGIGIREEDQVKLFEAFYRVPQHDGDPKRPRGTGIGLALVKAVAQAHDGTVSAKSVFGEGSTFSIILPISSDKNGK